MKYPNTADWWESGEGRNSYTIFETRTGKVSIYVRRHIADHSVMMIANIQTIVGFGASRAFYRNYTRDIPAIAEQIINPQLDALLERWGWDFVYRDLAGIPTRVNHAFQRAFPTFAEAHNPTQAIIQTNLK